MRELTASGVSSPARSDEFVTTHIDKRFQTCASEFLHLPGVPLENKINNCNLRLYIKLS